MREAHVRFTIRRLMVAVATAGIVITATSQLLGQGRVDRLS